MSVLPRLQRALETAARTPQRGARARWMLRWAAAGVAAAVVVGVGLVAAAGDTDPEREAAGPAPRASIGEPVDPPEPGGDPPRGAIELRAPDPISGEPLIGLYFTYRGDACFEAGPERVFGRYPIEDGGSCLNMPSVALPAPVTYSISSGVDRPLIVDGWARDEVSSLRIEDPNGAHDVPLSVHRAWFVAYPRDTRADVALVATLSDGSEHRQVVRLPLPEPPPVTTGPGRPGDPVEPLLRARPADVPELAVEPATGNPQTTFVLRVPSGEPRGLYAVSLDGPAGADCTQRLEETFGVVADERRGRERPLPPHRQAPFMAVDEPGYEEELRMAPWCPGRYRLKVRRIEYREKGDGRLVGRLEFSVREP